MKYSELKTIKARVAFLRVKLSSNYGWAVRGMLKIFEFQTRDEQDSERTHELNGIGFTGVDGEIMSSFSKQVLKGRKLSEKQQKILFKKMPKYAVQLEKAVRGI